MYKIPLIPFIENPPQPYRLFDFQANQLYLFIIYHSSLITNATLYFLFMHYNNLQLYTTAEDGLSEEKNPLTRIEHAEFSQKHNAFQMIAQQFKLSTDLSLVIK